MPALPDADHIRITTGLMRWWSNLREITTSYTKANLKAAVVAADAWIDTNSAAYNSALPVAFRNNATTQQKSLLLVAVILMRHNISLLRQLFGEVD